MHRGIFISTLFISTVLGAAPLAAQVATTLFPADGAPLPALAAPAPLPSLSAQACNACHGEIHDQWAASGHATASTNPVYRAVVASMGDPLLCRSCHLPLENQRSDLASGKGKLGAGQRIANPAFSPTLALEGVTCAACHVRDGIILGPRELGQDRAPHPVREEPALRGAEACASCHQVTLPGAEDHPFIDTVGEWSRSAYAEAGITCADCHMQRVSGIVGGSRYATFASHAMTEGMAPRELARALTLEVGLRATTIVRGDSLRATATLMNTGAGHSVPTGMPSALLRIRFEVEGPDGKAPKGAEPSNTDFRRVVEDEAPYALISDDRIPAGGSRAVDYSWVVPKKLAPGPLTLIVRVERLAMGEEQATMLGITLDDVRVEIVEQRIPLVVE